MNLKRIFTGIVCAAVAATSVVSPASAVMKHVGFDLSSLDERMGTVGEYFTEYVDGVRVRSEIRPTSFKWEAEGFEGVWPHAGYARLYALNSDTDVFEALDYTTYNATYANWATRWVNYDWDYLDIIANYKDCAECRAEGHTCIHFDKWTAIVWERQQTEIPGKGWTFDFGNRTYWDRNLPTTSFADSRVHRPTGTGIPAVTTVSGNPAAGFPTAGSVAYEVEVQTYYKPFAIGNVIVHEEALAKYPNSIPFFTTNWFITRAINALVNIPAFYSNGQSNVIGSGALAFDILSARDAATGRFLADEAYIAANIPVIRSKYVVGPTFDNNGNINGTKVVDLAMEWFDDFDKMNRVRYDDPVVALGLAGFPTVGAGRYTTTAATLPGATTAGSEFLYEFDAEYDYNPADYAGSINFAMPLYADTADVSEISWTEPACEKVAPFQYYQFLVVGEGEDTVVFNGQNAAPAIVRYLGAYADPAIASWADDYSAPVITNADGLIWEWTTGRIPA